MKKNEKKFSLILPTGVWVVLIGGIVGLRIFGERMSRNDFLNWSFYGLIGIGIYIIVSIIVEVFLDVVWDAD